MAYDWTNLIAPAFGALFSILAVILAWFLAKKSVNNYQQKRDERNQREILIEDYNNLIDHTNRLLISFGTFSQPYSGNSSFDFEAFKIKRHENLLDFIASHTLLVKKLELRMPGLAEEKLNKIKEFPEFIYAIYIDALDRIEKKTEIKVKEEDKDLLQIHLDEIYHIILTGKFD